MEDDAGPYDLCDVSLLGLERPSKDAPPLCHDPECIFNYPLGPAEPVIENSLLLIFCELLAPSNNSSERVQA